MVETAEPLDARQAATELVAAITILEVSPPDSPVARWFEYQAYMELVAVLRAADALKSYKVFMPDAATLVDWIRTGKGLQKRFAEEIPKLLEQLRTSSGDIFDNICRLFCKFRKPAKRVVDAADLLIHFPTIVAFLTSAGWGFLWIGGVAVTKLIAYLLNSGLLDKLCDCTRHDRED